MAIESTPSVEELPLELRQEFRDAIRTLANARRAEAWDVLFKCVRWALAHERGTPETPTARELQEFADGLAEGRELGREEGQRVVSAQTPAPPVDSFVPSRR